MPVITRMGVHASIAADQRPVGRSTATFVTVDQAGNELVREAVSDEPGLTLTVSHFFDVDDGRRLATEGLGEQSLVVPRDCPIEELRTDLREFIFEDELRELDEEFDDEPRWEDMSAVLGDAGVLGDEATRRRGDEATRRRGDPRSRAVRCRT
jgi:hypothetical protein